MPRTTTERLAEGLRHAARRREQQEDAQRSRLAHRHAFEIDLLAAEPLDPQEYQLAVKTLDRLHTLQRRDLEHQLRETRAPVPSPRPSAEQEATERRARPRPKINARGKSLERFGYWRIPDINPWIYAHMGSGIAVDPFENSQAGHDELTRQYGNLHRDGDADAIFEYARSDSWCFRSAWFVEQLEYWRDQGEDAKLRKVMAEFTRNTTKATNQDLHRTVARDQQIFAAIVRRPAAQSLFKCFIELANKFNVSEDTIRDVYEQYKDYFQSETKAGVDPALFFNRLTEMLARFP